MISHLTYLSLSFRQFDGRGKSASDKKEADHYWAAKAFKRGVPNAAPYFFFKGLVGIDDQIVRNKIRKDETPYFECCHPQCFCMKCNKPKIVSRFIDNDLIDLYCVCQTSATPVRDPENEQISPNWETYGTLGSSTHEEGPFALPYIYFEFLYVSLCDLSRKRTQGIKMSPNDSFLDETWERYLTEPRLRNEKPAVSKSNIGFAVQDCKFFLGLPMDKRGSDNLEVLFHYVHMLFRSVDSSLKDILDAVDNLPEDKRTGAELFDLVRDKRFRIPLMSVVFWHLLKDKPWGDVVTGNKFSDLVNESFMEYKNTVRKESEGQKYGVKELSYLYRTSPQIIIQNDLGLNVFGRGMKFYPNADQKKMLEDYKTEDKPILEGAQNVKSGTLEDLSAVQQSANVGPQGDVALFRKGNRQLATKDKVSPAHYKSLFDFVRSFERSLVQENSDPKYEEVVDYNSKEGLVLVSCDEMKSDENFPNSGVIVGNDLLRAALGTDCEPEIFQQKFAMKLANAVSLKDPKDDFPSLSGDDFDKLKMGVFAKGAVSSLATTASPLFKNKFQNYINALKNSKRQNGSPESLQALDRAINELIQQVSSDAGKLFVSKEGKVGMLLLTGRAMKRKREEENTPESVNEWIEKSDLGYDPEGIDGKTYDAIMRTLETDKSLPWMIATPTFESYLEAVLENPTFANSSEQIDDINDLIARSNALFDEASNPTGEGKFEDRLKKRNEAAMKITPPLKTTDEIIEDLCDKLITDQLNNEIPDSSLLNSLSAIDPESVYNNPGLLKIITESEMGVKSSDSNISNIEKMKKQLAKSGADTKPAKRSKDVVDDICRQNPDLVKCFQFLGEDLIKEACDSPNFQSFMDKENSKVSDLTPLEKIVFANECILNNKAVDPVRREALCKEQIDSMQDDEKAIVTNNQAARFSELFPRYENMEHTNLTDDNITLSEAADVSIHNCLAPNPEQSVFKLALQLPALIEKRFKELRNFAKENDLGEENFGDLGLTDSELNSAVRRALEALYNRALAEKGPDDNEVNAIGYLLEKAKQKELAHKRDYPVCPHCGSRKASKCCMVYVDDELVMRCLEAAPQCVTCNDSLNQLCLTRFRGSASEEESFPCCAMNHGEEYFFTKASEIVKLMLTDSVAEESSVSFTCEGVQNFDFWRKVQSQLDQNAPIVMADNVESTGKQACKLIWKNEQSPENAVDELLVMTALYETVEACNQGSLPISGFATKILSRNRAREVMDIAILALITVAELGTMFDDFQILAHTFDVATF
ncbi:uncharacterized protein LOC142349606 isoform X2 [Convolutriloba macropyga]|uniref:uncharacterized protein LOC142349606 isoform X2 n=1 Tax=Convolutriloba macropyga TaxID=536237 RepID=UPI003F5275D9